MAVRGNGLENDPYIVSTWADFMACPTTAIDPTYGEIERVYIKWDVDPDHGITTKYIDSITITQLPVRFNQWVDFNGFTFGTVTVVKTFESDPEFPQNCFLTGVYETWNNRNGDSAYLNLTINNLIMPDPRISLTKNTNEWHNCYISVTINSQLDVNSEYWSYALGCCGESLCPFGRDACFDECIINIKSEGVSTRIPIVKLINSELYLDYKWTDRYSSMGWKGVFPRVHYQEGTVEHGGAYYKKYYRFMAYNSYIGGTFEMLGGQGGSYVYLMRPYYSNTEKPEDDSKVYGISGPYFYMNQNTYNIVNIKFKFDPSSLYMQVKEPFFGYQSGGTNYRYTSNLFVYNNGLTQYQYRGDYNSVTLNKITTGDLKNPQVLADMGINAITDDNVRYNQYGTPFNYSLGGFEPTPRQDRNKRQSARVNRGIPFLPFWKYPLTEHWENYGAVDENPYICIFDMETKQNGFTGLGLAILEPTSCRVVNELNGQYNLTLTHPKDNEGKWQYLLELNIIKCLGQLFVIERVDDVQYGGSEYVTVYAEHITYTLNDRWLWPDTTVTGSTGTELLQDMYSQSYAHNEYWQTQYYFDMTSDVEVPNYFRDWYEMPEGATPYEMILGANGFVSKLGGELYRDNFTIKVNQRMYGAQDNQFELSVGLNVTGIKRTVDLSTFCTYFRGYDVTDGNYETWFAVAWDVRTLPRAYPREVVRSQNFTYDQPEYADGRLERDTLSYFSQHCFPMVTYEINITDLKRNPEYAEFANNFVYKVGDKGKVWDERLRAWIELEITRTEHNGITGECEKVCIGTQMSFTRPNSYTPFVPRPSYVIDADKILEGRPPLLFYGNGYNMEDWEIYGAQGGVGDFRASTNKFYGGVEQAFYDLTTGLRTDDPTVSPQPNKQWSAGKIQVPVQASTYYTLVPHTERYFYDYIFVMEYDANGDFVKYSYASYSEYCVFETGATTAFVIPQIPTSNGTTDVGLTDFMMAEGYREFPPYEPYSEGYVIPVTVAQGAMSQTTEIILAAPLNEGDTASKTSTGVDLPTYHGDNTLTVGTTVQPTMKITYRET